jgi:hypothetical protein
VKTYKEVFEYALADFLRLGNKREEFMKEARVDNNFDGISCNDCGICPMGSNGTNICHQLGGSVRPHLVTMYKREEKLLKLQELLEEPE